MRESHNARSDAAAQRKTSRIKCVRVRARGVAPCLLRETLQFWPLRRRAQKQWVDKRGIQAAYGGIKTKRLARSECGAGGFETRPCKRTEASRANPAERTQATARCHSPILIPLGASAVRRENRLGWLVRQVFEKCWSFNPKGSGLAALAS